MHTTWIACLLLTALASCSADPKSLTDAGYANLGKGQNEAALSEFEQALAEIGSDTTDPNWLRAAIGSCQARAHVDAKRAKEEFLALARTQPGRIVEGDFSLMANEFLRVDTTESRMEAIKLMEAGKMMFPESPKLHAIGNAVYTSASRAKDDAVLKELSGLGYTGGQ